jgi:hypothetical protein
VEVRQCLRVESATGAAATWGPVSLPLVLALDAPSTSPLARVITPEGASTDTYATWQRGNSDSLQFALRRLGYTGTLVLGEPGDVRAGVMRSSTAFTRLEEVVTTGVETAERAGLRRSDSARSPVRSAPREQPRVAAPSAQNAASSAPAVPVVARRIACPVRSEIR